MANKEHSFASNFLALFSSNISVMLLGITTSIIVARWLAPEGLGLKTVLVSFPMLFVSFFEMGVRQSTIYFLGIKKYNENRLFATIMSMWVLSSVIGLIIYAVLSYFQFKGIALYLISVSAAYIPIKIAQSFLSGLLLGKNLIKKLAKFNFANAVLTPIFTIVFLAVFDWGVFGVLLAAQFVALYTLIIRMYILRKELNLKFRFSFDLHIVKDLFSHGIIYAIALFLNSNFKLIPIFLMNDRISKAEIGIYSAGAAFALLLNQVIASTLPILFAKGANAKDHEQHSRKVQMLLRVLIPVLALGVVMLYFVLPYLIPLMYGDRYDLSIPITRVLLVGVFAFAIQGILIMDMAGKGKPVVTIKAVLPAFVLCVLFNYFGIERWGNMGAALSTSVAMVICGVSYIIVYSKETRSTIREILRPRRSDWTALITQLKSLKR